MLTMNRYREVNKKKWNTDTETTKTINTWDELDKDDRKNKRQVELKT